jgi:copper chaperone CopZ
MRQTINVTGMTCQNCVRHVRTALESLPGVRSVHVDLTSGEADLDAERVIPRQELQAALGEAGYGIA